MGMPLKIRLYFKNAFKLYEETDMTTKQVKERIYNDKDFQNMIGITESMVDNFWEALMDGVYDPERDDLKPQKYVRF